MRQLNRKNGSFELLAPVKVLQFGEGNFLRGFVDWIIDIMNEKSQFNGSVQVAQPLKNGMSEIINKQDGLYHVLLQGIKKGKIIEEKRLITCLKEVINPYNDYAAYLKLAENPNLKFVISNTTEAGISFNKSDTDFASIPDSFPGKLTALLYHRFTFYNGSADSGLTIIPCELIDKNGDALKNVILQYCQYWQLPEAFQEWIKESNIFCNSLVDRIVPGYPKDQITDIKEKLQYEDNLVVMAEPFHLWVIEAPEPVRKAFPAEAAGLQVKFVDDLSPYRTRKVRILNGAHTVLVPVAYLQGLRTVKEAVEDPTISAFINDTLFNEIIPTLTLPEKELHEFAYEVLDRFHNPFIRHELMSIALNSISKFKVRVLPSLLEYEQKNKKLPENLVYSLASIIIFYKGSWKGENIPLNDAPEVIEFFNRVWNQPVEELIQNVLKNENFWGQDLTLVKGLQEKTTKFVLEILEKEHVSSAPLVR